jgi:hypothetical protein
MVAFYSYTMSEAKVTNTLLTSQAQQMSIEATGSYKYFWNDLHTSMIFALHRIAIAHD